MIGYMAQGSSCNNFFSNMQVHAHEMTPSDFHKLLPLPIKVIFKYESKKTADLDAIMLLAIAATYAAKHLPLVQSCIKPGATCHGISILKFMDTCRLLLLVRQ